MPDELSQYALDSVQERVAFGARAADEAEFDVGQFWQAGSAPGSGTPA